MYNEQVVASNPNERIEKFVAEIMNFYSDLSAEQQITAFNLLKESVLRHRDGMINDAKSDLEACEIRLKSLYSGMEILNGSVGLKTPSY